MGAFINELYGKITQRPNSSKFTNIAIRIVRLHVVLLHNAIFHPKLFFKFHRKPRLTTLPRNPLVSIIVPTFNQEKYLRQCLTSIIAQSYKNIEIIIVDDGSNLETKKILQDFATLAQVRIISNKVNLGLPHSLDLGFGCARGELLTWVSSDNYLANSFVDLFVSEFLSTNKAGIIYSDFEIVDEESSEIGRDTGWRNYDRISNKPNRLTMHTFRSLQKVSPINVVGASFMMRREVFLFVGGHYAMQGAEDQSFWINASLGFQFKKIRSKNCLYFYRIHKASLTSKIQDRDYIDLLRQVKEKSHGQA